jgi:hypothetical protein
MPVEWTSLVGLLLTLVVRVAVYAASAVRYRKKCELLHARVRLIEEHLRALVTLQWTPDEHSDQLQMGPHLMHFS